MSKSLIRLSNIDSENILSKFGLSEVNLESNSPTLKSTSLLTSIKVSIPSASFLNLSASTVGLRFTSFSTLTGSNKLSASVLKVSLNFGLKSTSPGIVISLLSTSLNNPLAIPLSN